MRNFSFQKRGMKREKALFKKKSIILISLGAGAVKHCIAGRLGSAAHTCSFVVDYHAKEIIFRPKTCCRSLISKATIV